MMIVWRITGKFAELFRAALLPQLYTAISTLILG